MSRRNTELLLLIASAFPVILLYAMYVLTAGATISFETLAVPIGLFAAFAAAHIAVRILAPGADPAILPIVFVLSGIGITFVTRLAPDLAICSSSSSCLSRWRSWWERSHWSRTSTWSCATSTPLALSASSC